MITARLEALGKRLTLTVAAFCVLPTTLALLCLWAFAFHVLDTTCRDFAASELAQVSSECGDRIGREFTSAAQAILTLSHAADDASGARDAFADALEALRRNMPWLAGAAVLTSEGDTVLAAGSAHTPDADALLAALASRKGDETRPLVTNVAAGPDALPGFFLAAPMHGDALRRAVCLRADASMFSALLDRVRVGRTGEAFLMDADGALLTRSVLHGAILEKVDEALALSTPEAGAIHTRDWRGTRLWFSVLPVQGTPGWRLVVQRDELEILQKRNAQAARLGGLGLLVLAGLGAAALATVRKMRALHDRMDEERTRVTEHDMQVRKLDAISQLGVGIAHEVNNPLAIIGEEVGWMQDVLKRESFRDHPDAGELRDSLRQIVIQTARSREITHKLLSFGGKTDGTIRDTDLNSLVSDVALLRRREATDKGVEVREELADRLPVILSEPALLRQLLIILLNNCLDAMPEGGIITLATAPLQEGGARLEVRDTGFGIPRENLDRIFDPFFTTKPPGRGAGLGLSICHGIMQRIGGRISADSVPGQGTTVTVDLPLEAGPCKP